MQEFKRAKVDLKRSWFTLAFFVVLVAELFLILEIAIEGFNRNVEGGYDFLYLKIFGYAQILVFLFCSCFG